MWGHWPKTGPPWAFLKRCLLVRRFVHCKGRLRRGMPLAGTFPSKLLKSWVRNILGIFAGIAIAFLGDLSLNNLPFKIPFYKVRLLLSATLHRLDNYRIFALLNYGNSITVLNVMSLCMSIFCLHFSARQLNPTLNLPRAFSNSAPLLQDTEESKVRGACLFQKKPLKLLLSWCSRNRALRSLGLLLDLNSCAKTTGMSLFLFMHLHLWFGSDPFTYSLNLG